MRAGATTAMAGLLVGSALLLSLDEEALRARDDRTVAAGPAPASTAVSTAAPRASEAGGEETRHDAVVRLPDGALPSILDEPSPERLAYCDPRQWARLDAIVQEVGEGELIVREPAWEAAGASARAGLAGWASKCRLDGAALLVRSAGSGHILGRYDPAAGYTRAD